MPVRNIRVNHNLKETYESRMDILSKIYIYSGWLIGIYRLPVVLKIKGLSYLLTLIYSLLFCVCTNYYILYYIRLRDFGLLISLLQYSTCVIITVISLKTVRRFYVELFEFDEEIGSKFLASSDIKSNFVQAVAMYIFIPLFAIALYLYYGLDFGPKMLPMDLSYVLEVYYYGHLFGLLDSRLKSIRILLLLSFPTKNQVTLYVENESIDYKDTNVINLLKDNSKFEIRKLMFLYFKIIKIYDCLNSAVKWQVLRLL